MDHESKTSKGKDTPAVLMNIIRDIPKGSDIKQREQEKNNFEKKYKESDKRLDKLVQEHHANLTSIIQAFSAISTNITTSQQRIRAIKDNLQSCKNLLHCKRDELRKLWIEGIEHKIVASMLDQIEQVKDVSDKLQVFTERKHYLHATELVITSYGDLGDVEALKEIKVELQAKKEELFDLLIDELNKQIYVKSTASVVKGFQRQESMRQSGKADKVSYLKLALKQSAQQAEADAAAEAALSRLNSASLDQIVAPQQIHEDLTSDDPESDPVYFISILVESLAILKRLPEAIDTLRSRIKPGLFAIVQRASQQIADNACVESEEMAQTYQPQLLLDLLLLVFKQFHIVARVHEIVLANMKRIKTSMSSLGDFCLYDAEEVWTKIQAVLQQLLGDYLDIRHTAATAVGQSGGSSLLHETSSDVSAFFSKKKATTKQKKFALFRFESSSHAISINSYMREQRQEFYGTGDVLESDGSAVSSTTQFVCKPCTANITVIYNPLQRFLKDIETTVRAQPGTLDLQVFIRELIKDIYLGQVMSDIQSNINNATIGLDAQRIIIPLRTQRELDVPKPLLQSTVTVASSIEELCNLMRDLPDYADHFVNMVCSLLQEYRETCHQTYDDIVKVDEKRIISATWATDADIQRLLRLLPSWHSLQETILEEETELSEEDQRAMNTKESSILTTNLTSSEALIPPSEVLQDSEQLRTLGNLCESLEWFSRQIKALAAKLKAGSRHISLLALNGSNQTERVVTVSESTLLTLDSLSKDFVDLAETCLLVLHLEVRVLCFHLLVPIAKQSNYWGVIDDMDPDANVTKLCKKLSAAEEKLSQSLQAGKFRYVFDGLGHLIASILISSTQYLKRINENGIKKMCRNVFTIQQCLTNITMNRESDLDHARHYYELLHLSADDVLQLIVERGLQFSETEYTQLLNLKHRSDRSARDEDLPIIQDKLSEILAKFSTS